MPSHREGQATRYDPEKVKERYRTWNEAPRQERSTAAARQPSGTLEIRAEHVEQIVRAIAGPLLEQLTKLTKEVAALNGVRMSLMQKYDATAASTLARAEGLAAQLSEARKLVDLDMRVARLAVEVGRLSALVTKSAEEASR